ncbi:hypothetical protein [Methylobacterium oxalidis]|nr:hypothetical protein [Methylobacterium oxalidis]GJE34565.1 hypothetical protein LDDCCGHA_4777 [Methylobacterium oxalidis]
MSAAPAEYPYERVEDPDYFRDVLLNMEWIRNRDERRVRFSTVCASGYPDYQTEYPEGHRLYSFPRRYDGSTHRLIDSAASGARQDEHLTEAHTWNEVLLLLKRALDRKHGRTTASSAALAKE